MALNLDPKKARIFRIVHVENIAWMLDQGGLQCNCGEVNPHHVRIGNPDLIEKRASHPVPIAPGGVLGDYVPFYFTPLSIMMYNIHTGRGVPKRSNEEIVILASSLSRLRELGIPFVFTDQHAYAAGTNFYSDLTDLDKIDWALLSSRDFKTNDTDPGKGLRYQAEALAHRHVPLAGLLGICCNCEAAKERLGSLLAERNLQIDVKITPKLYF